MAKFRYAVLENDKAEVTTSTSGTITKDLPEKGILSTLQIMYRHTGAWVDNTQLPPLYAIKKIEVLVDGSTVVKSIDGPQCRALMAYNGGPFGQTNCYQQSQTSNFAYHDFHLYFGRNVNDTKYGLDLSRYANPQVKITYDEATTTHDGVTYDVYATPAVTYNIMAKLIDGIPAGWTNKYIQTREINKWTIADSEETNTEIPRGQALRGLMLRAAYKNKGYFDMWDHVKLDFDNGKWVPIDMDYENFLRLHLEAWPDPVHIARYAALQDSDDLNMELYYVSGTGWASSAMNIYMLKLPIIYWPISTVTIRDNTGGTPAGQGAFNYVTSGWGPMQTFYIPMKSLLDGYQESIDTTQYGRIDLKTTSGSSTGTTATPTIVAEYEKPNGQ